MDRLETMDYHTLIRPTNLTYDNSISGNEIAETKFILIYLQYRMTTQYFIGITILSMLFSIVAVPVASAYAVHLKLIDKPDRRKRHVGSVPLAGGIVVLAGVWIGAFSLPQSTATLSIAYLSIPLFFLGAVDDRFDISARSRLFCQLVIGCVLILYFNISIIQLEGIVSHDIILLPPLASIVFTLMCSCGVLNAVNMSDGIDGLLGSLASISLFGIAGLAIISNATPEASLALLVVGLLAGYLAYNLGFFGIKRRVFLGDSGSMLIGLVLLVLLIDLTQKPTAVMTATSAGWILGLPLLDTVSVMIRRVLDARSPFSAGRDHFHHILQDLGLSRKSTLKLLVTLQSFFVLIGIFANNTDIPQYIFFWLFVLLTIIQYMGIGFAVKKLGDGELTKDGIVPKHTRNENA